jgi:diguanylate cyclase (GGDEF)-like protein
MKPKSNLHILVIDDNPEIQKDFKKILMTDNSKRDELNPLEEIIFGTKETPAFKLPLFQVDSVSQGEAGVEKILKASAEGDPYALAFVDIRMPPGLDGIETIKRIWDIEPDMQIVICTAYSDYSWEDTIAHLGQKDNLLILKKPFDNTAVRQLSCALTLKWQLLKDLRDHAKFLEENENQRKNFSAILEEKLQHQLTHDPLTALPNKIFLADFIHRTLINSDLKGSIFVLLYCDLDRFKLVNEHLNYSVGNQLLKAIAQRLKLSIRKQDILCRLENDEFAIVITSLENLNEIESFVKKILNTFLEPFIIEEYTLFISVSIGVSVFPQDGKNIDELFGNASAAMVHSKELGGNQFHFYNDKLGQPATNSFELETDLHHAIGNNEFILFYQPQLDIKTEEIIAAEALIRWKHPTKGLIHPINFIPLAESTGLIVPIGEWVIKEACKQNKKWQDLGLPPIRVAVNLSALQLKRPNLTKIIEDTLLETGLKPEYLELELTESIIINCAESLAAIASLKTIGAQITLDDFGTGFSSLNYLREMSIDRIKIDQSFVKNIHIKRGDEIIIQAIITMAQNLKLEVLAEGVETEEQLTFLRSAECNAVQGYYFSKPISSDEFEYFLKNPKAISAQAKKRSRNEMTE